jgi:hypothetical protein
MRDVLRADLAEIASVDISVACDMTDSSEWKIRKEVDRGELESFMDGRKRKITVRSIKARMERLIKAQNQSPTIPPPPDHAKIAKAKAEARARKNQLGTPPPRRDRPRKPKPTAAATTATPAATPATPVATTL